MRDRHRYAFSLVEVMVAVAALSIFSILISRVWLVLVRDMPASMRLVARAGTMLEAVEQVHQDMAKARALPSAYGLYATDDNDLLMDLGEEVVLYRYSEDVLTRSIIGPEGLQQTRQWYLPDASFRWNMWTDGDRAYAVELRTHLIYRHRQRHIRLPNAYVFFLTRPAEEMAR